LSNPYNAPAADLSQMGDDGATYQPQLLSFSGRIGRARYLAYAFTFLMGVSFAGMMVAGLFGVISSTLAGILSLVLNVAIMVLGIGYARRRLNDMDRSGWWLLLGLIPLVAFGIFIWLACVPGDERSNDFGPPPVANNGGVVAAAIAMPVILVAMIGILAAVAIPAYKQYTERAKAASMQSAPAPALPDASQ
jgi:uncharacterized membrane protein YhaH (DUF805 family)